METRRLCGGDARTPVGVPLHEFWSGQVCLFLNLFQTKTLFVLIHPDGSTESSPGLGGSSYQDGSLMDEPGRPGTCPGRYLTLPGPFTLTEGIRPPHPLHVILPGLEPGYVNMGWMNQGGFI